MNKKEDLKQIKLEIQEEVEEKRMEHELNYTEELEKAKVEMVAYKGQLKAKVCFFLYNLSTVLVKLSG